MAIDLVGAWVQGLHQQAAALVLVEQIVDGHHHPHLSGMTDTPAPGQSDAARLRNA
jgi:hypothetical protein